MHQVNTPFIFYHDGVNPTHYAEGLCDIPADAAAVAEAEGWATPQANESEVVTSGDESDAAAVAEAEGWATPQANESEVVTSGDESDAAAVAEAEGKSKRGRK